MTHNIPPEKADAFEERAAILQFEAGYSKDEAERLAREIVSGVKSGG